MKHKQVQKAFEDSYPNTGIILPKTKFSVGYYGRYFGFSRPEKEGSKRDGWNSCNDLLNSIPDGFDWVMRFTKEVQYI